VVPNAVVRNVTVDKNTGLANGVNFIDRASRREMHVGARAVVLGASCLESTRILLNSKIANSSGVLGHYLHDQFYIPSGVAAIIPEARDGKAPRGLVGSGGYIPRFRNLVKGKPEKNFIRGYALDFYTGGTPDAKYFPGWGEVLPRFENHVSIDKNVADAWGIPALHFNVRYTDNEFNMAKDAVETMSEICHGAGFEVLNRNDKMFPPGYSIHELGTCRMGDNPKTSVLNKWN
jgi:choline dehydrogenase-like flavoprotein